MLQSLEKIIIQFYLPSGQNTCYIKKKLILETCFSQSSCPKWFTYLQGLLHETSSQSVHFAHRAYLLARIIARDKFSISSFAHRAYILARIIARDKFSISYFCPQGLHTCKDYCTRQVLNQLFLPTGLTWLTVES